MLPAALPKSEAVWLAGDEFSEAETLVDCPECKRCGTCKGSHMVEACEAVRWRALHGVH